MSNEHTGECAQPGHHGLHICQLKKRGLHDEVRARSAQPAVVCHNCNASADRAEDVCNPGLLAARNRNRS